MDGHIHAAKGRLFILQALRLSVVYKCIKVHLGAKPGADNEHTYIKNVSTLMKMLGH